jgi:hypothetical protein
MLNLKNFHFQPLQVTYAALDQKALKKGAGGKPASTNTPTEYAAIQVP